MVDEVIGRDLLAFGVPVLVLGDPVQLPPPRGCGFFTAAKPDVMLTEIHRQARDNPIIRMSMMVREGRKLDIGTYGTSRVIAATSDIVADQHLVGRNRTRRGYNSSRRRRLGLVGDLPQIGDKIVCLRNDHAKRLLNGSLWRVERVHAASADGEISMAIRPEEGGEVVEVATHAAFFTGPRPVSRQYDEFDYGYALTVHKAQGSQWGSVSLLDEFRVFPPRPPPLALHRHHPGGGTDHGDGERMDMSDKPAPGQNVVPFGKYKGQPVEVLLQDHNYREWLAEQPWLREKHITLYQTIINYGGEPESFDSILVSVFSGSGETSYEEANTCNCDPSFSAFDGGLEVFCQATVASEPSEASLDHPAFGLGLECADTLRSVDDLNRPPA